MHAAFKHAAIKSGKIFRQIIVVVVFAPITILLVDLTEIVNHCEDQIVELLKANKKL